MAPEYMAAVIDLLNAVISIETAEERKFKAEQERLKEAMANIPKEKMDVLSNETMSTFEKIWSEIKPYYEAEEPLSTNKEQFILNSSKMSVANPNLNITAANAKRND